MTNENNEYILGEDVTSLAAPETRKGTAILSVRVSGQVLAEIEAICRTTGRSVSQVVRDALASYVPPTREPGFGDDLGPGTRRFVDWSSRSLD